MHLILTGFCYQLLILYLVISQNVLLLISGLSLAVFHQSFHASFRLQAMCFGKISIIRCVFVF